MDGTKLNKKQLRITKRQLRRIIQEEKAKLLREAPAGQYDAGLYEELKAAINEAVYDVIIEMGFVDDTGMDITPEAVQAATAALTDVARELDRNQGEFITQKDIDRLGT